MNQVLAFLLLGVGSGALISGVGVGVVLSYRGAGLINLTAGALAMVAGFFFWAVRSGFWGFTLSTAPAVTSTVLFSVVLGVAFELIVVRPQRAATPLAKLVASLGALIAAQAGVIIEFGPGSRPQPSILTSRNITLFGVLIPLNRFVIGGIIFVLTVALLALYRWTRFGLGTRAASENEVSATLMGLSPGWLSLVNTVLMSVMMGVVGLLAASVTDLDSSTLPLLVVPGLAAALFGSFTSFEVTFIAGIGIGMGESLILYASTQSWFPTNGGPGSPLPGVQELLVFVLLVLAMYLRAGRIPGRGEILERRLPAAPKPVAPARTALLFGLPAAAAVVLLPGDFRDAFISSLIAAVLMLSIVVITGLVGQVSVVQLVLAGVSGFAILHFATNFGLGFPLAPLAGVGVAIVVGMLAAIPALRVRGVSLVVVTLAAAVAIENFGFDNSTWGGGSGAGVPPPEIFGFNFGPGASFHGVGGAEPSPVFGWVVLGVLILVALFVCNLRRSGLGQEMLAIRANERAAAAVGINVRNMKLLGFAMSAGVAGVGGVLLAYSQYGSINADSFDTLTSLSLIAFAYICGITTVPGAISAGIVLTGGLLTFALQDWFGFQGNWTTLTAGLLLILVLVRRPEGLATALFYRGRRRGVLRRALRPALRRRLGWRSEAPSPG